MTFRRQRLRGALVEAGLVKVDPDDTQRLVPVGPDLVFQNMVVAEQARAVRRQEEIARTVVSEEASQQVGESVPDPCVTAQVDDADLVKVDPTEASLAHARSTGMRRPDRRGVQCPNSEGETP